MHYHLEVIMPRTNDIKKSLSEIMEPFDENSEDADGAFWDFYVIGGRFAGSKEMCGCDKEKLSQFFKMLAEKKVTVSGIQFGKQSIDPPEQIPMVDKIWNEFFPTENGEIIPCPLFAHSNNQFDSDDLLSCDISLLEDVPPNLKCGHVIIAGPSHDGKKTEAHFMMREDAWNGVNHMPVKWDGTIAEAVNMFKEKLEHYREEWRKKVDPQPNWLCITVDYHS